MKKIIKRVGNSVGITFSKEQQQIYKLKEKSILEFDIIKISPEEIPKEGMSGKSIEYPEPKENYERPIGAKKLNEVGSDEE